MNSKICFLLINILIFEFGWESIQRPRVFVTESFKNFRQFSADWPMPRFVRLKFTGSFNGNWVLFCFKTLVYNAYCPEVPTFRISFQFDEYFIIHSTFLQLSVSRDPGPRCWQLTAEFCQQSFYVDFSALGHCCCESSGLPQTSDDKISWLFPDTSHILTNKITNSYTCITILI